MREGEQRAGFTLLELIVVVILIGILSAGVAPLYRASIAGAREDEGLRLLLAAMKHAQERAMSEGAEFRLLLDIDANRFWLVRFSGLDDRGGKVFRRLPEPRPGAIRSLPKNLEMERPTAQRDRRGRVYYVSFYPSGACDYATIRLRARDTGERIRIETKGTLGRFEVDRS